jgi:hypothetical protein
MYMATWTLESHRRGLSNDMCDLDWSELVAVGAQDICNQKSALLTL